jgi:hypothetical protein
MSLEDDFPERVMITSGWGFVVVKCVKTVFVFTVNGLPFQKVPLGMINSWFFFVDVTGADFVAVASADGKVQSWEIGEPSNKVELEFGRGIAALGFNAKYNCYLAVSPVEGIVALPKN